MRLTPDALPNLLTRHKAPAVTMMIGVPGSGKSYIAQKISEQLQWPVLSSDGMRFELTGDENDLSRDSEVRPLLFTRAEQYIAHGSSLIVDATHNKQTLRQGDVEYYRLLGARSVAGIYVDTLLDLCLERNASRDRVVPTFVIEEFWNNLHNNPPQKEDGFDAVYTISQ
ncbi:hypothetical protein B7Z17_00500 [Candidatus Saccharibacteria bacterium 32-49-10]|nr:MAG: hypothetical protein B7Z17_00500 [Candidatus Saccharibacteria bacterium 32-49-10]